MLFRNGENLSLELLQFLSQGNSVKIYAPYIKVNTLQDLLSNVKECHSICVRWEPRDILTGASDLEIYEVCKKLNIPLFRNSRLHLKVYLRDYSDAFITSANISSRALNLPLNQFYNYEIGTTVLNLDLTDRAYFSFIESSSILITDEIYEKMKNQLKIEKDRLILENEDFNLSNLSNTSFLISSLPLTSSPELLFEIYKNKISGDQTLINIAAHDLGMFNIKSGLNKDEFFSILKIRFFNQPFIKLLVSRLNNHNEMFFGEVKEFIHKSCTNVPLPKRWEITYNIQVLYKWLSDLSDGEIQVDVPYNHSQRIRIIK